MGNYNDVDINEVRGKIEEQIEYWRNTVMADYVKEEAVYRELRNAVESYNNAIDGLKEHESIFNSAYSSEHYGYYLRVLIHNKGLERLKIQPAIVDSAKQSDQKGIQFCEEAIAIFQQYDEDVVEFLNETHKLKEQYEHDEKNDAIGRMGEEEYGARLEEFEAKIRFIGHYFEDQSKTTSLLMERHPKIYE